MGLEFLYLAAPGCVTALADGDWAGEQQTAKSTSSGKAMLGSHLLESHSCRQQVVALSSGEAEFYSMGLVASEAPTVCRNMDEMQKIRADRLGHGDKVENPMQVVLYSDSATAQEMAQRHGCGPVRHLDTRWIWLQYEVRKGTVTVKQIPGESNPADVGAKHLPHEKFVQLLPELSLTKLANAGWQIPGGVMASLTLVISSASTRAAAQETSYDLALAAQAEQGRMAEQTLLKWKIMAVVCGFAFIGGGVSLLMAVSMCVRVKQLILGIGRRHVGTQTYESSFGVGPSAADPQRNQRREVATQAPFSYSTRGVGPLRFRPLGAREWGAWPEAPFD